MDKVKIGVLGCGNISAAYMKNFKTLFKEIVEVTACADINADRASALAGQFGVPLACTPRELFEKTDAEIILNLTAPAAHFETCRQALEARRQVYVEKPMCVSRDQGRALLALAKKRGLRLCGAPDTFMGSAAQTMRRMIDDGEIGSPVAACAFSAGHGHEGWHPSPAFFYKPGGGPLMDKGGYFLTILVNLLGPVDMVSAAGSTAFPTRVITADGPDKGKEISVEVPTHTAGLIRFESGITASVAFSFDIWAANLPYVEIYGTEGTLSLSHPFAGPLRVQREREDWRDVPLVRGYPDDSRGLGVADMAAALRAGKEPRAGESLVWHVTDTLFALSDSMTRGEYVRVESSCRKPLYFGGNIFEE